MKLTKKSEFPTIKEDILECEDCQEDFPESKLDYDEGRLVCSECAGKQKWCRK